MNSRDDTFSQEENRDLLPHKDIRRICSLPPELNSTHIRGIITQQVSIQIASLQLDVSKAQSILGTYSDNEFNEKSYNQVINQVVEELQRQQQSYRSEQSLIRQNSSPGLPLLRYISSDKSICCICLELQLSTHKLDCHHSFCEHCLQEYIVDRIMNGHSDQITCPEDNCPEMIPDQKIFDLIGVEYYDKMVKFRKIKELAKDPNLRQCPRIGCELFKQRTETHCLCGQEVCLECGSIVHPNISCNQQLDLEFAKAVKQLKIYHCHQCNSPIQKNEGCNHMTCTNCQYEFCWLCKSRYTSRHFSKFNIFGCPSMQYSEREPFDHPNLRRLLIFLGIVILGPPCLVLFIILYTFCLPSHLHIKIIKLKFNEFKRFNCFKQMCYVIFWLLLNIALLPLSVIAACIIIILFIIYVMAWVIYLIAKKCC